MTIIFILPSSVNILTANCGYLCTISPFKSIHFHPGNSPLSWALLCCEFMAPFYLALQYTTIRDCKIWEPHRDPWMICWSCKDMFKLPSSMLEWLSEFLFQGLIRILIWNKSYLPFLPHTYFSWDQIVSRWIWHTRELV